MKPAMRRHDGFTHRGEVQQFHQALDCSVRALGAMHGALQLCHLRARCFSLSTGALCLLLSLQLGLQQPDTAASARRVNPADIPCTSPGSTAVHVRCSFAGFVCSWAALAILWQLSLHVASAQL